MDRVPIERVTSWAYTVPTDAPEADGTLAWDSTTMIVVEIEAGGRTGLGYTYASAAVTTVVADVLGPRLLGEDAFAIPRSYAAMISAVRNLGSRGLCSTAISAADMALWDLKARLLDSPLATLFGQARDAVPIYGSGGFTTYSDERLRDQLAGWVGQEGCRFVKMKIGADIARDLVRMGIARDAIGDAALMIDANGALGRKAALQVAERAVEMGVVWFEEPVSSEDLAGLRLLRDRAPAPLEIAAGEYGWEPLHFKHMIDTGAVDVIQPDATRCGGYTGFLKAAMLADIGFVDVSAHTAPALHLPVCCAAPRVRHMEWFHDHVRIERMFFDGVPEPRDGLLLPDLSRPGHGLAFRRSDAERYAA